VLLLGNELFLLPPAPAEFEKDHFEEGPNVVTDEES